MPPKAKKYRISTYKNEVNLVCEFSHCEDSLEGVENYVTHAGEHITIMRRQLKEILRSPTSSEDVDQTKCECPWRNCSEVLNHADDWHSCERHIYFHAFHTYLKALGDAELINRHIPPSCSHSQDNKNSVPGLLDRFHCKWLKCQFVNDNPWKFYRHVDDHAVVTSDEGHWGCSWDRCTYAARNKCKLLDHLRSHTQEKLFACSACGSLLSNSTKFADHHMRQSIREHNFQCSHCSKQFATERILRDHLRKHVNLYNCMFCEMTCPNPSGLRVHILYRHSTERPYTCPVCPSSVSHPVFCKSGFSKFAIQNTHHAKNRFKREGDQRVHIEGHANQDSILACGIEGCNYKVKSISSLQKHNRQEHQERPIIFECHICSQRFERSAKLLSNHLRIVHSVGLPSGHVRFRYTAHTDGIKRLVTVRYEGAGETSDPEGSDDAASNAAVVGGDDKTEYGTIEVWNISDDDDDDDDEK